MGPFLAMVKANLKMTVRNRQALFWNLAFPAIFILIFGVLVYLTKRKVWAEVAH